MKDIAVDFNGGRASDHIIANERIVATRWFSRDGIRVMVQRFNDSDLKRLARSLMATEPFRSPPRLAIDGRHGVVLSISFWDGRSLLLSGSPPGSLRLLESLKDWVADFTRTIERRDLICDSGPALSPVASPTDNVAYVRLDSPASARALKFLAPLVIRPIPRGAGRDGGIVLAALDPRAEFSFGSGLVTDGAWLYWGVRWRFDRDKWPFAWGIVGVAKNGGQPALLLAVEDPASHLGGTPDDGYDSYSLLGVDGSAYHIRDRISWYCSLLWRLPRRSPAEAVSAVRHFAYWFNTDPSSYYMLNTGGVVRRTADRRDIVLGPLQRPTSDGRHLFGYESDAIWRASLEDGARNRIALMRADVDTDSPLKTDASWLYFYRYSSGSTYYFFRVQKAGGKPERLFPIGRAKPESFAISDAHICWCSGEPWPGVFCGDKERGPASEVTRRRCAGIVTDERSLYWFDVGDRTVVKKALPRP